MRLNKMFYLAVIGVVVAMAFVGTTLASATSTQLCNVHTGLTCGAGNAATSVHEILATGTVGKLLSPISVLCLGVLAESSGADVGGGGSPQRLDATSMSFTGCGTGSAHNNCTVTVESLPDNTLLKTGLDAGSLEALNGASRLQCSNLGINCLYDLAGSLFSVGGGHLVAEETPTTELGGKFFCPDEGFLDGDLEMLETRYAVSY